MALRSEQMSPEQTKAAETFKQATVDNKAHKMIEETSFAITDAANQAARCSRRWRPKTR